MPIRPSIQTLQATTPKILNAIRNDLGGTYADLIPLANDTAESIQAIGKLVMEQNQLQNSFLSALVNRIGMTIITSRSYTNPWQMFKKGKLDFGESIEEVFVQLAKPYQFDPADASETLYKQYTPDVSTAFHRLNFAKIYPTTIREQELHQAFLSMSGITDLIARIVESLYTGMEYDEFIMMKYLLAKTALAGKIKAINIPNVTKDNMQDIVTTIKSTSNNFEYMNSNYNMAGVTTHSTKDRQYIILDSNFDAKMDVEVLASAFNMDKADFFGHRVGVDSFSIFDNNRLKLIFSEMGEDYTPFTNEELAQLATLPAFIIDQDFFMIYDNFQEMKDVYNSKGLYWNYFLHTWKTFSISPFANGVLFTTLTPSVTSVSITPSTATMGKGTKIMLLAEVDSSGFANNSVKWSVNSDLSVITPDGQLTVGAGETAETLTVTATSIYDSTKTATATIIIV